MKCFGRLLLVLAATTVLIACANDPDVTWDQSGAGVGGYVVGIGGVAAGTTITSVGTGGASLSGGSGGSSTALAGAGGTARAGSGGAGSGSAGINGASGKGGASAGTGACTDSCPAPQGGVTVGCKKRFMFGVNYAWGGTPSAGKFATDFGGKASWSQKGVDGDRDAYVAQIKEMKDNGVDVIRWWMFPNLQGDGIVLDSSTKTPTGLGTTVEKDITAALAIAEEQDVHIQLTLFSFDNFRPDSQYSVSTSPIATDNAKRAQLMEKVVRPIARVVEASPNKDRMIAWDVINEPEWAIKAGSDPYGDPPFDGTSSNMSFISFSEMESFIRDVVTAIKAESQAPVTVGSAAIKWAKAWSNVGLDYYDFHWYGWVDQYFPHSKTPTEYGVGDKPVVVGEFPLIPAGSTSSNLSGAPFGGISYGQLVDDFLAAGYAGTLGWAYNEGNENQASLGWSSSKTNVKAWADAHPCYTHY